MEHLETIELMPDPSGETEDCIEHLEIELLRDGSVLIIKTPDQQSFQISKDQIKKLITALQKIE